nr:molybdate ABC transporter substrate-binding protein [Arthrobacter echini]
MLVPFALMGVLTACGSADQTGPASLSAPASSGTDTDGGSITVFAAASLEESFTELADRFEETRPGTVVTLNVAGSSDLATQISEGAPADVFASADEATMERIAATDLLDGEPVTFATNTLQLAVPPDNPADITSLADAARPGIRTVVCAAQVPCGAAAERVAEAAGVELSPVSEESSVTDVLGKISSGEADAGLVYVTDVRAAGDAVEGIAVPEAADVVNTYPIAALTDSEAAETAHAFVDFVTSADGRTVLEAAGFGAP